MIFSCIYRPPEASDQSFANIMSDLQHQIGIVSNGRCPEMFIMGDLNLPLYDWESNRPMKAVSSNGAYQRTMEFVEENFLSQMVDKPTRGNNILDIILTNSPQYIAAITTEDSKISDHRVVECTLGFNPLVENPLQTTNWDHMNFRGLNLYKADFELMNEDLSEVEWDNLQTMCEESGDTTGEKFKELIVLTVLQLAIKHSPKKSQRRKNNLVEPLKRRRRKLKSRIAAKASKDSATGQLEEELVALDDKIRQVLDSNIERREQKAIDTIKSSPRFFFSYAKRLSKAKSNIAPLKRKDGVLTTDNKEKADLLQAQYCGAFSDPNDGDLAKSLSWVEKSEVVLDDFDFSPEDIKAALAELDPSSAGPDGDIPAKILTACRNTLCVPLFLLWEKSFEDGRTPDSLKIQFITPIFKRGDKTLAINYRPVSLTSNLLKTFERVMRNKLVDHLEENNLLPDSQHGFRKRRGCLTQLLNHMDNIFNELNSGNEVDVVYLDYSKAFDKVNHSILLAKLEKLGIGGKILAWIKDFLSDRYQTVVVEGKKSSFEIVRSGVPQGTVLGPILFIIYVADLQNRVLHCDTGTFADDTKLQKRIVSEESGTELQEDLERVVEWSAANSMVLHEDKFEVVHYELNKTSFLRELPFHNELRLYVTPAGNYINPIKHVRDLGIMLSDDCSWTPHVMKISSEARRMAAWTLRAFKDRSVNTMLTLFKSLVRCKLEYCSPLWSPYLIGDIQALESVQRRFTRRIDDMARRIWTIGNG